MAGGGFFFGHLLWAGHSYGRLPSMADGPLQRLYLALAPHLLPIIESVLVLAVVILTFRARGKVQVFLSYGSFFSRLARRKILSIFLVGFLTFAIRVAFIPVWGIPQPSWHDEFSFLLAADTFAHGRVTNPPHPMWKHFEGFHIIQQPTYMSMYPPGQGIILAAGQLLGHPWIGQLVTTALMCSCLCWMLQGWVPPPWALLGALLLMMRVALLSYWMNSYFATSLPAIGGMLVLGALPRIRHAAPVADAVFMAVGLAILANTRPYEGLVFSAPFVVGLIVWIAKQKRFANAILIRRVIAPMALIVVITGTGMGYYFWRVTGSAVVMPYQVNRRTYAVAPYFIWQKPRPEPEYRHAVMRNFYTDWEMRGYIEGTTVRGFVRRTAERIGTLWAFFVGPVFTLPLLAFPWLFRDRRMRLPLIVAGVVVLGNLVETWTLVHYLAPALGLFYLLLVQSMRHLRLYVRRGRALGHGLVRAVVMVCVAVVVLRVLAMATAVRTEPPRPAGNQKRNAVEQQLRALPGKQLVIVHYSAKHIPHEDWINNRADIDAAKIVWARDMGTADNRELVAYFKDRKIWLVNADDPSPAPQPYSSGASQ